MLSEPQDTIELKAPGIGSVAPKEIAPVCASFPSGESNSFFCGTEDGSLYNCARFNQKNGVVNAVLGLTKSDPSRADPLGNSKADASKADAEKAHSGPITG